MREKRNFAERTRVLPSGETRKKYFLVYEGKKTEGLYFDGIMNSRNEIGIDPLIELVPIVRSYSEEGWSNPGKIVDRILQNLKEAESGIISYETLLNWIMDYLEEEDMIRNNRPAAAYMWGILEKICIEKMNVELSDRVGDVGTACMQIARHIDTESQWDNVIEDVPAVIEDRALTYDKEIDKICFIIDRDRDSFVSTEEKDQYHDVLDKCRRNAFGFYLTNPCFEFWLLLHFEEVLGLDIQKLLDNPKVSAKRRYTEQELRRLLPGYSKSKYNVGFLMSRIGKAIENEKNFCEDENQLEYMVGSRVGLLMKELIK